MSRDRMALALLTMAALTACPSKPPSAELLEADGPLGDAGVDGMIEVDAPSFIDLGFPTPLPGTRPIYLNDLIAIPLQVTASQAGEVVEWGVQSASGAPGTQIRMAIYGHTTASNQPDMLLTQSGAWNLSDGMKSTSGFSLAAGSYWLTVSTSAEVTIGRSITSPGESRECLRTLGFTTALPTTWSSSSCFTSNPINLYLRIHRSR
jgi:hypothetical protein